MRHAAAASLFLVVLAIPALAHAQRGTVAEGMSRDEVVARLGEPAGEKTSGSRAYMFYRNGCERRCGTPDVIMLEDDAVTDVILRGAGRRYTGSSSSPRGATPRRDARESMTSDGNAAPIERSSGRATGLRRGGIVVGTPAPGMSAPMSGRSSAVAGSSSSGSNAVGSSGRGSDTLASPSPNVATPQAASPSVANRRDSTSAPVVPLRAGQRPAPYTGSRRGGDVPGGTTRPVNPRPDSTPVPPRP